jgi:rubrerythrin
LKDIERDLDNKEEVKDKFELLEGGLWKCNVCGTTLEDEHEAYEHLNPKNSLCEDTSEVKNEDSCI